VRIGIDARGLCNINRTRGIGRYTARLVEALVGTAGEKNAFTLFGYGEGPEPGLLDPGVLHKVEWRSMPHVEGLSYAGLLADHAGMARAVNGAGVDLFHAIDHNMTPFLRVPSMVTVHDLILLVLRGPYLGPTAWAWMLAHGRAARRARLVVAVSENTRRDIERLWSIPRERIAVVHEGVTPQYRPVEDPESLQEIRARYGIDAPYFLYLGGFDPRKNLRNMLAGFKLFLLTAGSGHRLVLCGDARGFEDYLGDTVEELGLGESVALTGFVPEEDLPALYSGAVAFVCVSLYEGFGLPLLEAMACGTPVLASDTSSIPEVVGDAGLLVDPLEPGEIAAGLERLAGDAALAERLSARGRERAAGFTWERAAGLILELYDRAARGGD
jgi:glycosyltransferase involved in cell wall biosynthesis